MNDLVKRACVFSNMSTVFTFQSSAPKERPRKWLHMRKTFFVCAIHHTGWSQWEVSGRFLDGLQVTKLPSWILDEITWRKPSSSGRASPSTPRATSLWCGWNLVEASFDFRWDASHCLMWWNEEEAIKFFHDTLGTHAQISFHVPFSGKWDMSTYNFHSLIPMIYLTIIDIKACESAMRLHLN